MDGADLWLHVSTSSGVPIYVQLKDQLRRAIQGGTLRPGDQLPTVRDLAARTVVNPNTVARVYRELEAEGFLTTQRGVGTYVAPNPSWRLDELARQDAAMAAADAFLAALSQLGMSPAEGAELLLERGRPPKDGAGNRAVSDKAGGKHGRKGAREDEQDG